VREDREGELVERPRGEQAALPIAGRAHFLLRHDIDVARMPDIHGRRISGVRRVFILLLVLVGLVLVGLVFVGLVFVGLVLSRRFRAPRGDTHEDRAGLVGPRRTPEGDETAGGPERAVVRRVVLVKPFGRRTHTRPGEHRVRRPFARVVGLRLEDREIVRILAPCQAEIPRGPGVEHAQRAGRWIEHLHAVAGAILGGNRNRQETSFRLPRRLRHVPRLSALTARGRGGDPGSSDQAAAGSGSPRAGGRSARSAASGAACRRR
jgi:hypothetical protein